MPESWSYIKGLAGFINKISEMSNIPENATFAIADIVGLYPNIWYKVGLKIFKNALEKRKQKHIYIENLINMAEFVLKTNFF